ncbi:MAG: TonB-dependent receptor, partial [Bryobacterales bacterium]|nr:TonB-dependent receptor [Bryobacterales bacterium]
MKDNSLGIRSLHVSACLLLALAVVAPRAARGQLLQGSIDGKVTDPSQAAVAGAKVVATDQGTGFVRDAVTGSAGFYSLPNLPPGTYTVTISSQGFQTYTRTGVGVTVQTVTRIDAALNIGAISESVTVSAQEVALQADRADVRSEIGADILRNAPMPIGRNYQMLFVTLPGVSPPQNAHSFGANSSRSLTFTVNGGSVFTNDTRVDGAGTRNFSATGVLQYIPALEAIETVNVATSSFDADQSSGGGFVSVTVKSGTNAVHGALFENHADRSLEAYAWAADRTKPKVPFISNQFGGAIGGPIKKDKLFYFVSYEGTRLVQGNTVVAQVPTPAMKAGNLSASPTAIYDPMTGNPNGSGRSPFAGNVIPSSRIDSGVRAMIATGNWPDPNQLGTGTFGLGRNFLCTGCQGNSGARRDQWDAKLTWNPSGKLSMFARIGLNDSDWYNPQIFGLLGGPQVSPSNGAVGVGAARVYNGTLSATYVFTPHLLVDAYFGYSRNNMYSRQPNQDKNLGWTLLAIPGLNTSNLPEHKQLQQGGMPRLTIDGFAAPGPSNGYQPQGYSDPQKNINANVNWVKGSHNIRAGFDSDFQDSNEMQYEYIASYLSSAGGFRFAQGTTQLQGGPAGNDMNAFGSFLLGLPQESGKIHQFPDEYYTRNRIYSLYVRDRWQVGPKLTLSYGVRFDYFPFPTRRGGTGFEYYNPASATMSICGVGSIPEDCGITRDKRHFNPRLGLAYRITNSTVIRAGYSMAADPNLFHGKSLGNRENFPYLFPQYIVPPNSLSYGVTFRQGLPAVSAPDTSSGTVPVPGNVAVTSVDNGNYVRGYIQTWNFTLEQRFKGWLASAGYVASRAIKPQDNLQLNWSPINGGTAGQILNKLTGRTASTVYLGTLGTNTYDSLQVRAQRRFEGFQIGTTYTWGKGLGYSQQSARVMIPQYYRLNRGPLDQDFRHLFAASGVAELPFGKGKRWAQQGVPSMLAGGWQLSTVLSARVGQPFTASASNATLNATFSGQFADCVSPPQLLRNTFQWYAKSSFAVPASGRFGTCGTNRFRGPGLINADLGVERKFRVTERFQLAFRGEMFNISNTPHHVMPGGNASVNSGTFLQATDI